MKVRNWVKVSGLIVALLLMFLFVGSNSKKAINECVKNGNSQYWCELHLN